MPAWTIASASQGRTMWYAQSVKPPQFAASGTLTTSQ